MKYITSLVCVALVATVCGCAGYNHTLFMTKSTVGLDFDAKPPTAEITVSRKEAVITPVFEGGQTPPVMASFKPEAGVGGGFANFLMGVDQTFAGGDSAYAMAKLYGSPETPQDHKAYDSKIQLNPPPHHTSIFKKLSGPGEVKPLIFGTDSMLGIKVAWSGVGGQFPDSLKAGFVRKEFAWAPVTMKGTTQQVDVRIPSFLATIDSNITADTGAAKIQALQYFATGESATLLAMQPQVRQAMLARLDPNSDKLAARWQGTLSARSGLAHVSILNTLYQQLGRDAGGDAIRKELEKLDASSEVPNGYVLYSIAPSSTDPSKSQLKASPMQHVPGVPKFIDFLQTYSDMIVSIESLKACISDPNIEVALPTGSPSRQQYLTDLFQTEVVMTAQLKEQLIKLDPFTILTQYFSQQ